jgi:hypothetical protein
MPGERFHNAMSSLTLAFGLGCLLVGMGLGGAIMLWLHL